jgi:hypothetical protein
MSRTTIAAFESEYRRYRGYAEGAVSQLTWEQLREALSPEVNSVAVVMKHVGGNLRSRWTDVLTTDGEKPWRNRDSEFIDDFAEREDLLRAWDAGWGALEGALAPLTDADLGRVIAIRGEPHTLVLALTRSLAHTAYHCGQIVQCARVLVGRAGGEWKTMTVARGQSEAFNRSMGFEGGGRGTPG